MTASERAAWLQLTVCLAAIVVVAVLFPWLGQKATGGFAVLALIALTAFLYRQRDGRVVVDERDRQIEKKAISFAVGATWVGLVAILAVAGMWSSYAEIHSVSAQFLNWLIWGQFLALLGIKAMASVYLYRSRHNAA